MEFFKTLGCYPPEYNRAVHGPYYPWRYYGPKDTSFGQVKLAELGSWFARRQRSPRAAVQASARAYETWAHRWVRPLRASSASLYQFIAFTFVVSYICNRKAQGAFTRLSGSSAPEFAARQSPLPARSAAPHSAGHHLTNRVCFFLLTFLLQCTTATASTTGRRSRPGHVGRAGLAAQLGRLVD